MRINKIRKLGKENLEYIVKNSKTLSEILRACDLDSHGGYYDSLKKILFEYNIDYSHIPTGFGHAKNRTTISKKAIPIEDILSNKIKYTSTSNLKTKLIKLGYLENKCSKCNLKSLWQNEPIMLQLDHIDGNKNNNEIINLRILCPNCHSQTITFAGRAEGKLLRQFDIILFKTELAKLLWEMPISHIAKKYKLSQITIRNAVKKYGLVKPSIGYWIKKRNNI